MIRELQKSEMGISPFANITVYFTHAASDSHRFETLAAIAGLSQLSQRSPDEAKRNPG